MLTIITFFQVLVMILALYLSSKGVVSTGELLIISSVILVASEMRMRLEG